MAALRLSLVALLLALCACSLPGRSASAIGGLFSATAAEKITQAGGTVEVLEV